MKPINELLEFCIVNLDKPAGFSSHQACDRVRKILKANKAGHTGTLDYQVTGVLPILLNKTTRLSNYFMKKDKVYIGKMYIHKDISELALKKIMKEFVGKINQKPPRRSSVKRVMRERTVNSFKILKKDGKTVSFSADVEAGTYIRKLVSDLGEKIGGAHMIELRRTKAGIFDIKKSFTLEQIELAVAEYEKGNEKPLRKILIPAEIIKEIIPPVEVKEEIVKRLLNGSPIFKEYLKEKVKTDKISVFCKDKLIGIYKKVDEGRIIAWPEVVFNNN